MKTVIMSCAALAIVAGAAQAGLTDTRTGTGSASVAVDGTLSANEYGAGNAFSYAGGGTGFGGSLGGGTLYMNSDATNLYIGLQVGGGLDNIIALHLNTSNAAGFTSSTQMDDNSDGGRRASSDPMANGTYNFAVAAQYSFVMGNFGAVLFELQPNGTQHAFKSFSAQFTGNGTNFREYALSLADLGGALGARTFIDWSALLTSDTAFLSNETIPAQGYNGAGNPGFDNGGTAVSATNFNRFAIPAPGAVALLGLAGIAAGRRRR